MPITNDSSCIQFYQRIKIIIKKVELNVFSSNQYYFKKLEKHLKKSECPTYQVNWKLYTSTMTSGRTFKSPDLVKCSENRTQPFKVH